MPSVTGRIKEVKQPRGGYIKPSSLQKTVLDDNNQLNDTENISPAVVGMVVDYLSRFMNGTKKEDAFSISMNGALISEDMGQKGSQKAAKDLLNQITGLDNKSIVSACKLVSFDVWYRNPMAAMMAKPYDEIDPDATTVNNIKILVNRMLRFFEICGPFIADGFTFEPNGYSSVVTSGDGDFLSKDTLWDIKVSKSDITNKYTLQILMYYIMGKHSGQEIYKNINKIGIFNPRLNVIYKINVSDIPEDVIKTVEKDVICY